MQHHSTSRANIHCTSRVNIKNVDELQKLLKAEKPKLYTFRAAPKQSTPSTCSPSSSVRSASGASPRPSPGQGSTDKCSKGSFVSIGAYRFQRCSAIGNGSFGEVWAAKIVAGGSLAEQKTSIALKDIICRDSYSLDQALLEANLLSELGGEKLCMPRCLAYQIDATQDGSSLVRIAMTRVPGEPLENFFKRQAACGQDQKRAFRNGCSLAKEFLLQLGPAVHSINRRVFHRDVNPRNILLSDAQTGDDFDACGGTDSARFGLVDFGLAVDSGTWASMWSADGPGGDFRYMPPSAWLYGFHGEDDLRQQQVLQRQYMTRLDSYALGMIALELICSPALRSPAAEMERSWTQLLTAFRSYQVDVTRWNLEIYSTFSQGGDYAVVRSNFQQEGVVMQMLRHISTLCSHLRSCTKTTDAETRCLLWVIAELLDEHSVLTLSDTVGYVRSVGRNSIFATPRLAPTCATPQLAPPCATPRPAPPCAPRVGQSKSLPDGPATIRKIVHVESGSPKSGPPGVLPPNSPFINQAQVPPLCIQARTIPNAVSQIQYSHVQARSRPFLA